MSYIIGREIHPDEVLKTNEQLPKETEFNGSVFSINSASPTEIWATKHLESLVAYEREKYDSERPISISSWPTLDPLNHPTESGSKDNASLDLSSL